jgi:hypothetical protein
MADTTRTDDTDEDDFFDRVQIVDPNGRYTDALVASMANHTFGGDRDWFWFTKQHAAQVLTLPERERGAEINRLYVRYLKAGQPAFERERNIERAILRVVPSVLIIALGIIFFNPLVQFVQGYAAAIASSTGH